MGRLLTKTQHIPYALEREERPENDGNIFSAIFIRNCSKNKPIKCVIALIDKKIKLYCQFEKSRIIYRFELCTQTHNYRQNLLPN